MLLASTADITAQLGFDDMTDINAAVAAALNSVEPQLAVAFKTSFPVAEYTDTFWVPQPTVKDYPHVETQFWLSCGFISATPTVSAVKLRGSRFDFISSSPETFVIADGALIYDLEKGIARDWITYYHATRVTFSYSAGFPVDGSNSDSYDLTTVPDWLQQAAKLLALVRLSDAPIIEEAGVKIDVSTIKMQFDALISQHTRYAPMALIPL
jgi:hypothetical protein